MAIPLEACSLFTLYGRTSSPGMTCDTQQPAVTRLRDRDVPSVKLFVNANTQLLQHYLFVVGADLMLRLTRCYPASGWVEDPSNVARLEMLISSPLTTRPVDRNATVENTSPQPHLESCMSRSVQWCQLPAYLKLLTLAALFNQ